MADEYPDGQHHEPPRSAAWPHVRRAVLHLHPYCAACGKGADHPDVTALQVHHINPFHIVAALGRGDLELDPRNLIVLCETEHGHPEPNHHLVLGHLGNFRSDGNLDVLADCTTFAGLSAAGIEADPRWQAKRAALLPDLSAMTDEQKAAFRARLDAELPEQAVAA